MPTSLPVIPPLGDRFDRKVSYLRVSLTDRCNYRCTYCMPADGVELLPRQDVLSFEEIARVVRVFVGMGVRRVRLTGGEPTVRKDVIDVVALLSAIDGLDAVVMTSNGHRLPELAAPLAAAGLRGINISIDTLDAVKFAEITRRGDLVRVVDGIDASIAAGLEVKLNVVALKGFNESEVGALCAFAWQRGIVPRFIEHMPMSDGVLYAPGRELAAAEIRAIVEREHGGALAPLRGPAEAHTGPSRYWAVDGDPARSVGIIAAMTEHFCESCNRVRITAVGDLHTCLGYDDAAPLRRVIRSGGTDGDLRAAIRDALAGKREGHDFQRTGCGAPTKHMISIGG
jgi:cyclic pyranopterin phosphate synthase